MKVSFSATIGDVAPILIFLQLPQMSKPIQNPYFKLPRVHTIIALNERISQVIDREVLQLCQCSIVKIQIVRITCHGQNSNNGIIIDENQTSEPYW